MASTIKVDNVQNQPGTNIISKCSTTITLGASSDTIALACGASQTGFGRTGTVDWDTSIHTGTVTAATGKGYFVNTTSGGITVNLPAAAVGSIVAVSDYASTAASNNISITPNGSEKINGANAIYTIQTAGLAVTLVYADATRGWKSVTGSDADATGITPTFVVATGGTPCSGAIVCTNYKQHTFTGPGTLCVSAVGNCAGSNTVDYLVVAGGGGGGLAAGNTSSGSGGGGAGGYLFSDGTASGCYAAGPAPLGAAALPVSVQGYPITVGGGAAATGPGTSSCIGIDGANSVFSTITTTGGGGGGFASASAPQGNGRPGGSGGGGGRDSSPGTSCGGASLPVTSPTQGTAGGDGINCAGAGGGGAGVAGANAGPGKPATTAGGNGLASTINATPTTRAGGGGAGGTANPGALSGQPGGTGGGGDGGDRPGTGTVCGGAGTVNTGGGGGASGTNDGSATSSGGGGSGVVIIRYKFQ